MSCPFTFPKNLAAYIVSLAMVFSSAAILSAQAGPVVHLATVRGTVRDALGHAVVGATVSLQRKEEGQACTTYSDAQGEYTFTHIASGNYTLRAEAAGYLATIFGPLDIAEGEEKRIDLVVKPANDSQASLAALPQFYDEPKFSVAGVADPARAGGHGSDAVLRNTEAMARETVSLKKEASSEPATGGNARERSLREAADRAPENFAANFRAGKLLLEEGKAEEAVPYLVRASNLNRADCYSWFELAVALMGTKGYENADTKAKALLDRPGLSTEDRAAVHHLLAHAAESVHDPLDAERNYELAAEFNPSEPNFFDWGAELLLHNALEPAIEVFTKGHRLFPQSPRMLIGLGVAWFARGSYEVGAQRMCEASDLSPNDPAPYLFLGKILTVGTFHSEDVTSRLRRFAQLQPENALANYYYAVSLWNRREGSEPGKDLGQVESLLRKSVDLDPKLGVAYLQLGILYSDRKNFLDAISAYQLAIAATPSLEQAHFRLSQAYQRTGQTAQAQKELAIYQEMSKKTAEEVERQRQEIQQFVYTLQTPAENAQHQ